MKKTIITVVVCLTFILAHSQSRAPELPDGKHGNFKLTKVNHVLVDGVNHLDLDGTTKKYLVSLDFGKNTLNIELYEASTGKLIWGYYGVKQNITFKPNQEKSNESYAYYDFTQNTSGIKTDCEVYYTSGVKGFLVNLSYSEIDSATRKVKRSIIASGEVN